MKKFFKLFIPLFIFLITSNATAIEGAKVLYIALKAGSHDPVIWIEKGKTTEIATEELNRSVEIPVKDFNRKCIFQKIGFPGMYKGKPLAGYRIDCKSETDNVFMTLDCGEKYKPAQVMVFELKGINHSFAMSCI